MILESITVGPFQENCYIVGDESTGEGALIDPGDEATRIALAVEQTQLDIGKIIITHAHIDHVGAVADLATEYACPVLLHSEAEPMLKQMPTQAMMMGMKFGKVPTVDEYIEDEEIIIVGDVALKALYTPGHAPGHLAFYVEGIPGAIPVASESGETATGLAFYETAGTLFSADALFAGSVGRVDLPGGSMEVLMKSINERLLTLPDDTVVYPGHGPATTIGDERATNPFLTGRLR